MDKEVKLKYVLIIALVALVAGFFIGERYVSFRISNALKNITTNTNTSNDDTAEAKENIIEANIGDKIKLATIDVVVNSAEEIGNISVSYGSPIVPSEGAKLIKVDFTITNTTANEFTLGSNWTKIMNQDGKAFTEQENAYNIDNFIDYETLKPEIPSTGSTIFEVSKTSTDLYLLLAKAGTSDTYKINLDLK